MMNIISYSYFQNAQFRDKYSGSFPFILVILYKQNIKFCYNEFKCKTTTENSSLISQDVVPPLLSHVADHIVPSNAGQVVLLVPLPSCIIINSLSILFNI